MRQFVLVTDSTIDETAQYYVSNDIRCVPLSLTFEGQQPIEEDFGRTLPYKAFYDLLRQGKNAKTSQGKVKTFVETFTEALENGMDVLYVGFSSGLSGSYEAGCIARKELAPKYPDRNICCVDSLSASGGQFLVVDRARKLRDEGMSAPDAAKAIEDYRLHVIHLVIIDDLNHLWRGGRVSKSSAVLGTLVGIKPFIYVDNAGTLQVSRKIRGRTKAIEYLGDRMMSEIVDRSEIVRISHGDCFEDAQYLQNYILTKGGIRSEIRILGTVIGSHTGPGVMTIFFTGTERKP